MLARAVLSARTPAAEVVAGRGEEIPAEDRSFDVVIGASSWHWVDEERALPEVARVLRPGGSVLVAVERGGPLRRLAPIALGRRQGARP